MDRQRQDEDRQFQDEFTEIQRRMDRQRQDEVEGFAEVRRKLERRRQDEDAKLRKAAMKKKRAFEMESIMLQGSLLDVKKYDAEGAAKYDETPKVSDETFLGISEHLTTNFFEIDTKFVSAKVDDKNVSSRSFTNPSATSLVSPSATFPTVLPVDHRPSGRAWAATAPTFSSFDDFIRHSTTMAPFTPLQLVPLVPESMSTVPSQVSVSAVEVAKKDRQDADPPGSPDLPEDPQAISGNDLPDDPQAISGNDFPELPTEELPTEELPTEELTLLQEDGHCLAPFVDESSTPSPVATALTSRQNSDDHGGNLSPKVVKSVDGHADCASPTHVFSLKMLGVSLVLIVLGVVFGFVIASFLSSSSTAAPASGCGDFVDGFRRLRKMGERRCRDQDPNLGRRGRWTSDGETEICKNFQANQVHSVFKPQVASPSIDEPLQMDEAIHDVQPRHLVTEVDFLQGEAQHPRQFESLVRQFVQFTEEGTGDSLKSYERFGIFTKPQVNSLLHFDEQFGGTNPRDDGLHAHVANDALVEDVERFGGSNPRDEDGLHAHFTNDAFVGDECLGGTDAYVVDGFQPLKDGLQARIANVTLVDEDIELSQILVTANCGFVGRRPPRARLRLSRRRHPDSSFERRLSRSPRLRRRGMLPTSVTAASGFIIHRPFARVSFNPGKPPWIPTTSLPLGSF